MLQKWSLMQENGYLTEVVSLVHGEWLCYRGDHCNGGKMVRLQVASLLEGEWSSYRGG